MKHDSTEYFRNHSRMSLDPPQTSWPTLDLNNANRRSHMLDRHPEWTPLKGRKK